MKQVGIDHNNWQEDANARSIQRWTVAAGIHREGEEETASGNLHFFSHLSENATQELDFTATFSAAMKN